MIKTRKGDNTLKLQIILVILLSAVLSDLKTWKIRNEIIFCGFATSIYFMFQEGTYVNSLFGALIPIIILWPLFYTRTLGAGDIKLFSVLGSFYGYKVIPSFIIVAFFCGAIISIIQIVRLNNLKIRLQYFFCYSSNFIKTKKLTKYYNAKQDGREPVIHFSLAILMAHVFYFIINTMLAC